MTGLIQKIKCIFEKPICPAFTLKIAFNTALKFVEEDKDGMINVKEFFMLMMKVIKEIKAGKEP